MAQGESCPRCAAEQARVWRPGAPGDRPQVTSPEQAGEVVVPMLQDLDREQCVELALDTKHQLIAATTVSIGSVDHTFPTPREIFRDALLHNATAIVIAHNHPSGDAEPSEDHKAVTRRLVKAGELIGVEVLDHLIVGWGRWISLARRDVC